jgi:hypothetical protein
VCDTSARLREYGAKEEALNNHGQTKQAKKLLRATRMKRRVTVGTRMMKTIIATQ